MVLVVGAFTNVDWFEYSDNNYNSISYYKSFSLKKGSIMSSDVPEIIKEDFVCHYWVMSQMLAALFGTDEPEALYEHVYRAFEDLEGSTDIKLIENVIKTRTPSIVLTAYKKGFINNEF